MPTVEQLLESVNDLMAPAVGQTLAQSLKAARKQVDFVLDWVVSCENEVDRPQKVDELDAFLKGLETDELRNLGLTFMGLKNGTGHLMTAIASTIMLKAVAEIEQQVVSEAIKEGESADVV